MATQRRTGRGAPKAPRTRVERDTMGEVRVPASALWGAQTARAVENFPISTLREPLDSVEMGSHQPVKSRFERSDVCAVPAVGIVLEAVVALTLADAALERFGGATVADLAAAAEDFRRRIRER